MLKLLSNGKKGFWGDENKVFFEPNCGHGNIVVAIYRKRLAALHKKALLQGNENAVLYAISNAINTLWAIDIDAKNINQCRSRVLMETLLFLQEKTGFSSHEEIISQRQDFMAHLLCAINWHIHENETLSCLSSKETAKINAEKTLSGTQWYSKHGYHPLSFDLSWADHFRQCQQEKLADLIHQKAQRFIFNLLVELPQESTEFQFANSLIAGNADNKKPVRDSKERAAG